MVSRKDIKSSRNQALYSGFGDGEISETTCQSAKK